ncbi:MULTISPECIES: DUF2059 domain-containing protein [unclassified Leisingera]|uniref:DUF2059 domain-containing protein n=1 Tax=unclassified Leisingera TaxID=2614906 RepID=UPI0002E06C08|nr:MULTISPECIES: DUF2059 domain-containing protein [unclassified Leisingera]KIC19463.1 hypothetical protein RA21_02875 [Leisingera sp. ANG-DT]KIC25241.1 hypothetical protein RA23_05020 [Leisingera sp. ANG-S3]KIC33851.1 hypothetical protein RA25_07790 [Leisingera sp. ANG-S5]KIC54707.1 hypothetical protein RA22_05030 [Leisingera sp. ANG-S]KID10526.1 hypothetical protein GC1_02240 [Leisingera sp. ANG1]
MQMILPLPAFLMRFLAAMWLGCWVVTQPAAAADRARVEAFLEVTGFDVALDSIALSASSAPDMLGVDAGAFGSQWTEMSEEVFDTAEMRGLALDILENTLDDEALDHASEFYASDLGKRLVRAENSSHLIEDDEVKQLAGNRIISDLVKAGSKRVAMYQRMGSAIDAAGNGVKALQQIQFRFLMAASAAGVIDLDLDADELRALMKEQEGDLRLSLQASSLAASAYTYQEFSDAEVQAYVEALEEEPMQRVYELLNAVQYEITANRFEELAHRMAELTPGQDI